MYHEWYSLVMLGRLPPADDSSSLSLALVDITIITIG
jgi:hypothetical protein